MFQFSTKIFPFISQILKWNTSIHHFPKSLPKSEAKSTQIDLPYLIKPIDYYERAELRALTTCKLIAVSMADVSIIQLKP